MNYEKRSDSYYNVMTGLGGAMDKTSGITSGAVYILEDEVLGDLYAGGGLIASIIDNVPEDGFKNGWTYKNDDTGVIEDYCDKLNVKNNFEYAWKLQRIYGGSIIVIFSPNVLPEKPLGVNEKITKLRVYSRARINNTLADYNSDPKSNFFEDYEYFNILTKNGTPFKAHHTRCLIFKGLALPDKLSANFETSKFNYFGISLIQRIWEDVKNLGSSVQGIANVMQEIVLGKYTVEGLKQILAMNQKDALEKIMTRLMAMSASKSTIKAILLGENEKYERDTINLAGVGEVLDRFMMFVASSAQQPVTKLFGKSASGLNATGENDLQQYYDTIMNKLETHIKPQLDKLIQHVGRTMSKRDGEYGVEEFNSLWEMDDKQKAEIGKIQAETWAMYLDRNIITEEYVQEKEFPDLTDIENNPDDDLEIGN